MRGSILLAIEVFAFVAGPSRCLGQTDNTGRHASAHLAPGRRTEHVEC